MHSQRLNSGIIYTDSNCIGCNKCIAGCIAVGANVVVKDPESDWNMVLVDPNKCILCGTCIKECIHGARTYKDDTDAFFDALARGKNISILVSPTLLTDYEKQYHNILGYLKHLGVNHIYNTGFGGDLMVWVCMNFIRNYSLSGVISQFCPVIVNYLEKYKPDLLQYLLPVQSPMECTAIYVNDYLNNMDDLAFISPCIATKREINDVNTYKKVTYNVTFERLMTRLRCVDLSQFYADDELDYGLGALIPMAGGLSDNIERYIGFDQVLIQTSGPSSIFPYFDHYYKVVSDQERLPFLVEALSCTYGCNFGTGTHCGVELRNDMTFSAHRVKERAYGAGQESKARNYVERLELLNERFKNFETSSFVRQYDLTREVVTQTLREEELDEIYRSMFKYGEEQRHTDCGSCGYKSCRDMAYAIGLHANHKENCINYSKECIRQETEKINRLLAEISNMNEELKTATKLKSNFLANMSHEIRTPMNAIIGMAEMALRGELAHEQRSYIQQIKASGRSLLAIINDILDFSKIESGKMELNENEYKVLSIVNDTVNIIMTRIGEKDITLVVDADPNIPYSLYGDDIRIKQVLVNFANNAVKFTERGIVELSLQHKPCEDGIELTVAIRDTGIGIREEDLEKLFTSFQQVDSKRNRNVEGTGLGLVISREFVRLMNGKIHMESVYGEGSTFSFTIPQRVMQNVPSIALRQAGTVRTASLLSNPYVSLGYYKAISHFDIENTECASSADLEDALAQGIQYFFIDYPNWDSTADAFARSHQDIHIAVIIDPRRESITVPYVRKLNQPVYSLGIAAILNRERLDLFDQENHSEEFLFDAPDARILLVDDNAINLTVAKGLLSPLHMQLFTALSAMSAIEQIKAAPFDIIFMDHMMPDIDGVECTHMIRAMEGDYYKNVPIIALTANAINNAKEMFLSEGMNDFVAKPIEMADISAKIRHWLPAEKIHSLAPDTGPALVQGADLVIEGLDTAAGIKLVGTEELYRNILKDYWCVIEKKSDHIAHCEAEGNITAYTIEVHALKSASKLIGATALSELAARLEQAGHDKNWELIHAETGELLRLYRSYLPILTPLCKEKEVSDAVLLEPEVLIQRLNTLCEALDDFDIDAAKDMMDELEHCQTDERCGVLREKLMEAVREMEYDDAVEIAKEWSGLLEVPAE